MQCPKSFLLINVLYNSQKISGSQRTAPNTRSLDCAPQRSVPDQIESDWTPDPEKALTSVSVSEHPHEDLPFFGSILGRLHRMTTT